MRLSKLAAVAATSMAIQANAQSISLKGIVTDNFNGRKPVASATVKLVGANLNAITGADGKFTLTQSVGVGKSIPRDVSFRIQPNGFSLSVGTPQVVDLSIFKASGEVVSRVSQNLSQGENLLSRPRLENGIYLLRVGMADGSFSKRFMVSQETGAVAMDFETADFDAPAGRSFAGYSDTLVVSAPSFTTKRKAVTVSVDENMEIQIVPSCDLKPADKAANSKAISLLCYLKTHSYISGQTDEKDAVTVQGWTGRYPAMVARDFYHLTDPDLSETQAAIDFYNKKKGIVAFQWHWKAPRPSGRGEYYDDFDFPSALADANSQLNKDIKAVAGELKKLNDAGVPVLFRPLHEANNNFMWWQRHQPNNYKNLWRAIFDAATKAGAHNLVWNFNGMASGSGANTPLANWFPGDDQADVVSSDYYQSWSDYDLMKKIGTNKILGVAETWFELDPAKDAPFSHSVVWASKDWADSKHGGVEAVKNAWITAMKNPKTISIDQLPDMTQW